ncbi:MAG TPA: hypothetical protein VM165_11775, partial [Planctomycetaceae bacterium]|nr:hypothetical protein [Planctomycetaceae bacterium]
MTVAEYLVAELRELAFRVGQQVTLIQFCRETGVAPGTVARFCGSWTRLRLAAGLPARPWSRRTVADIRRLHSRLRRRQWRGTCSLLMWGVVVWMATAPVRAWWFEREPVAAHDSVDENERETASVGRESFDV